MIMKNELIQYNNLGTPLYFVELFQLINTTDGWTERELTDHFYNRIIDGKDIFDGGMHLLKELGILNFEENRTVYLSPKYNNLIAGKINFLDELLNDILFYFSDFPDFIEIFSPEYLTYNEESGSIFIHLSAFGTKYTAVRDLLIDFNFFIRHDNLDRVIMLNERWKAFFDSNFKLAIRKKQIGLEQLKLQLEQQAQQGERAELFVMEYEGIRLEGKQGIEWVAPIDVALGYDILSFESIESTENDRCIEVKSYSLLTPSFYWPKNEIRVAQELGDRYFLYLVDIKRIDDADYTPIIIQNPAMTVLNNDTWMKEVDSYFIRLEGGMDALGDL